MKYTAMHLRYLPHVGMCTYMGYNKTDTIHLSLVYIDKIFPLGSLLVLFISYSTFLLRVRPV
jgi:hypothetical protein